MNRPSKAAAQAAAERAAAAEKDELHSALREELRGYEQRGLTGRANAVRAQIASLTGEPVAQAPAQTPEQTPPQEPEQAPEQAPEQTPQQRPSEPEAAPADQATPRKGGKPAVKA